MPGEILKCPREEAGPFKGLGVVLAVLRGFGILGAALRAVSNWVPNIFVVLGQDRDWREGIMVT